MSRSLTKSTVRTLVGLAISAPVDKPPPSAPGGPRWLCRDHLPDEAGEVLDRIEELRRKQEPTRH
jgi:hypothetical protein